ncbi:MAG: class I SAM-dependent methyltransferase [Thermoplasmata archaeon]|nr:class I SAM-dependent methyltransferase [Thermoplasmata archaeon]
MSRPVAREPDWGSWLRSWDEQQESFNPSRERRFEAMLDVLAATQPSSMRVLDLGCGPGSLTARLLDRFPKARSTAVDFDPVILRVGQGALRRLATRITWVEADIGSEGWPRGWPTHRFHAAISTTALHWLGPDQLRRLHRTVAGLLRPGGVFLNGDYLPWARRDAGLGKIAEAVRKSKYGSLGSEWTGWNRWWKRLAREPTLRPLLQEREARFAHTRKSSRHLSVEFHLRSLRRAGFRDVGVVWQEMENRVVLARAGSGRP